MGIDLDQSGTSGLPIRRSSRLIILNPQNELLLFRYSDEHRAPFWATVGGELVGNETYEDAAQRELYEETGFEQPIGELLRERDEVYAVARSVPARWLERYFLVRCGHSRAPVNENWTDEERSTITHWRWWSIDALLSPDIRFLPDWLPGLVKSLATRFDAES